MNDAIQVKVPGGAFCVQKSLANNNSGCVVFSFVASLLRSELLARPPLALECAELGAWVLDCRAWSVLHFSGYPNVDFCEKHEVLGWSVHENPCLASA